MNEIEGNDKECLCFDNVSKTQSIIVFYILCVIVY